MTSLPALEHNLCSFHSCSCPLVHRTVVITDRKENDRATKNLSLELPNALPLTNCWRKELLRFLRLSLRSKRAGHLSQRHPQKLWPDFGQLETKDNQLPRDELQLPSREPVVPYSQGSKDNRPVGRKGWF